MEIEAKYRITAPFDSTRLARLDLGPFTLAYEGEHQLSDQVIDTPDRRISGHGYALRLRQDGDKNLVTLKRSAGAVKGAVHSRLEIELPADPAAVKRGQLPAEIAEKVGGLLDGGRLQPLVTVENHRRIWNVQRDGQTIAELALDEGEIRAGRRSETFRELELELKGEGNRRDLRTLTNRLTKALPLEPESRSKFARGLALLGDDHPANSDPGADTTAPSSAAVPVPGPGPAPTSEELPEAEQWAPNADLPAGAQADQPAPAADLSLPELPAPSAEEAAPSAEEAAPVEPSRRSILEVGREVILRNLEKLHEAEPRARAGTDPEGVHDMRVATRRLRAALQVMEVTGTDLEHTRKFRRQLRALSNSLAIVRDSDVFLENVEKYAQELLPEEAVGLDPLRAATDRQRAKGRKEMMRQLDNKQTKKLLETIRAWAESHEDTGARYDEDGVPQPVWVRHFAHSTVWRRYEAVLAYETIWPAPTHVMHQLRISGKRLRYTLEFFEEAMGSGTRDVLKQLAAIQDRLGWIQDAEVAMAAIDQVARGKKATPALRKYRTYLEEREQALVEEFQAEYWPKLSGSAFREQIARLLAKVSG